MNFLVSEVVFFRNLSKKDNILGIVYVFEVDLVMKLNKNNEVKVIIKEKVIFFDNYRKDRM